MNPIVGLLLAAGRSSRFGSDKLLHPLPDGQALISRSATVLAQATDECVALIPPHRPALKNALTQCAIDVIEAANADEGMGQTIASGVRATAHAAGWIIALGDMPLLQVETAQAVVEALRQGASLVAPFCEGQRGHPVGFSRIWFDALTGLQGDVGARDWLRTNANVITRIDVQDAGCLIDVDSKEDFLRLFPAER